ncbi:MAG: 2-C-methyl-D-erythritol 2,4-cyclodiphosphate synthase [Erysipelotrichaceae bacterium]|nr:2-C-methyl-D-erythritol 2,4-cyclodiphosphate synthase [Erysipelotrichaceae bacterium]
MMRIGHSRDIHRFGKDRKLILGGVEIPYELGLVGHSDADALTHAVIEAIIGALGLKDIGTHFPDTDPRYEGISSMLLLEETYKMMDERGYEIGNLDSLIMIERPKMAPHIDQMRRNIASRLHCDPENINVKATRGEGLGFVGEGLGVEADCVVLLRKKGNNE